MKVWNHGIFQAKVTIYMSASFSVSRNLRKILRVLLAVFVLTHDPGARALSAPGFVPDKPEIARSYGARPLSFETNQGQAEDQVRFLSHGEGYSILFKDSEADLLLSKKGSHRNSPHSPDLRRAESTDSVKPENSVRSDVLRMLLLNAHSGAMPSAETRLPGTVNYFTGDDPAKWRTGVPTFERVKYAGVYPGVDLVYYGSQQRLEFDFEVAAGADSRAIELRFEGARKLKLDDEGNLTIFVANGSIGFHKPIIYQPVDRNRRRLVEGSFRLVSKNSVRFRLGPYDHARPLVIDPILNYSTYLGEESEANAVAVDSAGEAYVAGWADVGLPTSGGIQPSPITKSGVAQASAFVAKFNSTGTGLIYCTYLSGSGADVVNGIALDSQGNAYVAGVTSSPDFPTTPGAFQSKNNQPPNNFGFNGEPSGTGFVAEINSTGTTLTYSTYLGGSAYSLITAIGIDSSGSAYVTGQTSSSDFPITQGAFQTINKAVSNGGTTGFISKLNGAGTSLMYSTYLGGSTAEDFSGISVDATGNAYVTGSTKSTDFPTTPGAFQSTNKAKVGFTGFVAKMNPAGTGLLYSTYFGGSVGEGSNAISVDSAGDAYLTGFTTSADFPATTGVFQPKFTSNQNAFITKLNASGTGLVYSTFLGGTYALSGEVPEATGTSIAVDGAGNALVSGNTDFMDFPITPGAFELENMSNLDSYDFGSFLTKINPSASELLYSTYLSGSGDGSGLSCDCTRGIALDSSYNVYLAGSSSSTDFPTTQGAFQISDPGSGMSFKAFVTEFSANEMKTLPATTTTLTSNVNPQHPGAPVTITATVQGIPGGSTPTGTIAFSTSTDPSDGSFLVDPWTTVDLDASGRATYSTSALENGQDPIYAYYLGDMNHAPSRGSMIEAIANTFTAVTVTSSANPAAYGTPVTFTATVLDTSGKPVAGDVVFLGTYPYAQVQLDSSGRATWLTTVGLSYGVPVGNTRIAAQFLAEEPEVQSNEASLTETVTAPSGITPSPVFTPPAGTYTSNQQVALSSPNPAANIYYTSDGLTPTPVSLDLYTGPIAVNNNETIHAIALAPGHEASPIISAAYAINFPTPGFMMSLSPASLTVANGHSATTAVTVIPSGGFDQAVSFSCTGLPVGASCGFSPSTVNPAGGTGSTTLSITVSPSASGRNPAQIPFVPITTLALTLGCIGFRKRRQPWLSLLLVLGTIGLFGLSGCGSSGHSSSPPPTSTPTPTTSMITVTAISGSISSATTLTLTVN
jgi:hypothetical protein